MDREEFERIKAEEKAHLQELKKLKTQFKEAQRTQKLRKAMAEINSTVDPDKVTEAGIDAELTEAAPSPEDKAGDLVRQFKIEMGMIDEVEADTEEEGAVEKSIGKMPLTDPEQEGIEDESSEESAEERPEKTLGRIRRRTKSQDDSEGSGDSEEPADDPIAD